MNYVHFYKKKLDIIRILIIKKNNYKLNQKLKI